jgi:C4-dicarboxylate transporter DctQ subunit
LNKVERAIQYLGSLIDRVTRLGWYFSGAAVTLMAFVITYNALGRYVLKRQDPYAYVISCILMVVCVAFAMAYTQRVGQHLRVDIMDRRLPQAVRGVLMNIVTPILALVCVSIMVWNSWDSTWFALQTGDVTGSGTAYIETWPTRMLVPIGVGWLGVVLIAQIWRYLASLRGKGIRGKE